MSQVLIDPSSLTAIGEAIRSKNKQTVKYKPNEMAGAIKALALDNSVVIQSNDAWKYAIDSTLEHESITVKVSGKLTGDNNTGYKSEAIFEPTIKSNFGYIAGKINKTVDSTNHIITFSAGPVTETDKLVQDGWTPVYVIGDGTEYNNSYYYTTTTPDDENSFKPISSSDNIENILICGYYKRDSSTGKLSSTDPSQRYVGKELLSKYTKKLKNLYATSLGESAFANSSSLTSVNVSSATLIGNYVFYNCLGLTSIDVSKATSIGDSAFGYCTALTSIDLSKATSIGDSALIWCDSLTSIDLSNATSISDNNLSSWSTPKLQYIVIDSNTVSTAHIQLWSGVKVLIPQSMMDAYAADSFWSSYKSQLDAIENYYITRENGQINVVDKPSARYKSNGPFDAYLNGKNITIATGLNSGKTSGRGIGGIPDIRINEALSIPYVYDDEMIVRTESTTVTENDWNDTNLNKLTITRESDGYGVTFTLGYNNRGNKVTSWVEHDTDTTCKCAEYDIATAVEHGCTLNDLIKSANNGDKLKLTFTSN